MDYKRKLGHIFHTLGTTGLAYMVNYGTLLVLTPYITETVGTEAYGFVSLAKQFAQYAVIVTTALNTYAARYIGIAYHKEEREKANTYFSSVFWGDLFLASGIMAAALGPIFFLERLIHIPSEIVGDVKILFLLIFLNFWVSTVFSVFGCAGYIKDKVAMTGMFKTVSYLVNGVILILAYALFPAKIFYIGIGAMGASLVVAWSDMWMTRRFTPDFHTKRSDRSLAAVKELVVAGCWASFNSVGEMLNHGLDLILCNQMISSLAMGQLAVAKTMYMVVQGLHMIIDQAFIPGFLKSYAEHDRQKLLEELKLSMKVSGLLANLIFAGFVSLGLAYYRLWIPGQEIGVIYKLTVITILTCISAGAVHPLYYVYTLTVKKMVPCLVTIAGGMINVAGMYVLIRYAKMGVYAVAWTTAAVMTVIHLITNPLYISHILGVPFTTFYPDIIRNVCACLALLGVFKGLSRFYMPSSWMALGICILVYAVLGTGIHCVIVCNKTQRKQLMDAFLGKGAG